MSKPDEKNPATQPEPEATDPAVESTSDESADGAPESDLAAIQKERDTYLENWKRERASFLNHKRWVEKERKNWEAAALAEFVEGLLPFIDDLDRAIEAARTASDIDALREGFEMTRSRFNEALTTGGAEEIASDGQPFDPTEHEAVLQMDDAEQPAGTVLQTTQRGYRVGPRLVRPAKVVVSKRPAGESSSTPPAAEEEDES